MSQMKKAKAIADRVFIRLDREDSATKGGIFLPETYEPVRTSGVVESVGDKVTSVKCGDRVLFHVFDELPAYESGVVAVRESSLLGVWEDEN